MISPYLRVCIAHATPNLSWLPYKLYLASLFRTAHLWHVVPCWMASTGDHGQPGEALCPGLHGAWEEPNLLCSRQRGAAPVPPLLVSTFPHLPGWHTEGRGEWKLGRRGKKDEARPGNSKREQFGRYLHELPFMGESAEIFGPGPRLHQVY